MHVIDPKTHAVCFQDWLDQAKRSLFFFTPFFTCKGMEIVPDTVSDVKLLVRAQPLDFLTGSIQSEALRAALDRSWQVRCSSTLHAKAYWDASGSGFFGSANLTGNGFPVSQAGNFEILAFGAISNDWINRAQKIWADSNPIDYYFLDMVDEYLRTNPDAEPQFEDFPQPLDPIDQSILRKFTLLDIPQSRSLSEIVTSSSDDEELKTNNILAYDLKLMRLNPPCTELQVHSNFLRLPLIKAFLEYVEDGKYFGDLRRWLEHTIKEVPTPSREDYNTQLNKLYKFVVEASAGRYEVIVPGRRSEFLKKVDI